MQERRNAKRKRFSYYMRVVDDSNQQLVGHLADISARGFKVDAERAYVPGVDLRLRLDLTTDIADKTSMTFVARVKWCQTDPMTPFSFNVGFEIVNIGMHDKVIFQRIVDKYGSQDSRWG